MTPSLDSLSPEAQYIGVGFLQSLGEAGFSPKGKRAVILGAGGGAKAIAFALIEVEASSIIIFNRPI